MAGICRNGHDLTSTPRRKDGRCLLCYRKYQAKYSRDRRASRTRKEKEKDQAENRERWKRRAGKFTVWQREERNRKARALNQEHIRDPHRRLLRARRSKEWRKSNLELAREYMRAWQRTFRQTARGKIYKRRMDAKRRARLFGVASEPYNYKEIVYGATHCGICDNEYHEKDVRSLDHIIPLAKGGADAAPNLQSAHLRCNSRKQDRLL